MLDATLAIMFTGLLVSGYVMMGLIFVPVIAFAYIALKGLVSFIFNENLHGSYASTDLFLINVKDILDGKTIRRKPKKVHCAPSQDTKLSDAS